MTVVGIGVDLCSVARIARLLERTPRAAARLFTPDELDYAGVGPGAAARLAARFATKEAVVKALGGAVPGMGWHDAAVPGGDGAPTLVVTGGAATRAEQLGVSRWHLSLSHDGGVAVAMVVAES